MSNLVPLGVKKYLPGLQENLGAVGGARHDGLLHHPPLLPLYHDGDAGGQEVVTVPYLCLTVHHWSSHPIHQSVIVMV